MSKIRLVVAGAAGRMGKTILSLAHLDSAFQITGALEHPDYAAIGTDVGELIGSKSLGIALSKDPLSALKGADALIDFSHHSSVGAHLKVALATKTAYVLGTTGLPDKELSDLRGAAKSIAIVHSPNMSVGVNLLFRLAEITSKVLDESYDIEIVEAHHRLKKDSPSGTAMKLLEVVAQSRKRNLKKDVVFGREGEIGARPEGQIGVSTMRGGDVVGDHTVFFLGNGERIELTHKASSREAFAQGALRAAKFAVKQKPGLYNMQQVLGIA